MVVRRGKDRTFFDAFGDAFREGREEWTRSFREGRTANELSENAPRWTEMTGAYPTGTRVVETAHEMAGKLGDAVGLPLSDALGKVPLMGKPDRKKQAIRNEIGIGREEEGRGRRIGQNLGTLAGDLVADNTRNFYWLLNAAQATGNVIAESTFGKVAPDLYGSKVQKMRKGGPNIDIRQEAGLREAVKQGLIHEMPASKGDRIKFRKGVRAGDDGTILKRNHEPGDLLALGIPTGVAINTGLGLMSPFGGAEGYKAAVPDDEDPTKSANVLQEVAQKYFLGQTGKLLPYSEFSKVRPDVSPEEYRAYQAFKYDKDVDLNPFDDGVMTAPGGIVKYNNDGIHGAEVQFLGRSLPVNTGLVPYAAALAGGAAGLTMGGPERRIRGGVLGGFAGLAAGQVAGHLLENERRRRNTIENQLDQPQNI